MYEPSAPLHAASMHRTLAPFAEVEPALLIVLCTNLSWRRSFLSALMYLCNCSRERERGKFVDRGAAATLVIGFPQFFCNYILHLASKKLDWTT